MKPGPRQWCLALLVAAMLHASLGIGWMLPAEDEGAETEGDTGIEIMLGDDGAANEKQPSPTAEPAPPAEPTPEVKPEPKPTPVPPKPVPPQPQPKLAQVAEPLPETPTPTDALSTVAQVAPAAAASAPPPPPQPQSGGGIAGGATTARKKSYFGELAAHLARHQRYPVEARRRKITGIVTVHFSFDQAGRIREFSVKNSSGNRLLDDEALAMLKRAQPLPPIPKELGTDLLSISLPIDFSLRRK